MTIEPIVYYNALLPLLLCHIWRSNWLSRECHRARGDNPGPIPIYNCCGGTVHWCIEVVRDRIEYVVRLSIDELFGNAKPCEFFLFRMLVWEPARRYNNIWPSNFGALRGGTKSRLFDFVRQTSASSTSTTGGSTRVAGHELFLGREGHALDRLNHRLDGQNNRGDLQQTEPFGIRIYELVSLVFFHWSLDHVVWLGTLIAVTMLNLAGGSCVLDPMD